MSGMCGVLYSVMGKIVFLKRVLYYKIENTILFSIFKIVLKSALDNFKIVFQNSFQNSFVQHI